jgi:hypothetical protein
MRALDYRGKSLIMTMSHHVVIFSAAMMKRTEQESLLHKNRATER